MDFPLFHLDLLGNRLLIAVIATLHVVISHALGVGGMALVAWMERKGLRDPDWDVIAKKTLFSFFVVTTTVGALTGVGIWFSASLVNPTAIGSLIRVFFWAWFAEWLVFVTEVVLILFYYLTWDRWTGDRKKTHVRLGFNLALFSWITMIIIVAILAFMMDPGSWHEQRTFLSGFLNPVYLPQLAFRTPLAMVMAGGAGFLVLAFSSLEKNQREKATREISKWILFWLPLLLIGALLYYRVIPDAMKANMGVSLTTQEFVSWYQTTLYAIFGSVGLVAILSSIGTLAGRIPRPIMILPFLIFVGLMGTFERSREFIRKPYAIGGYLYANGLRKDDYPLLQKEGVLKFAPYVSVHEVTSENVIDAGREVFTLTCTRCHTVDGVNSIRARLQTMYGNDPWKVDTISSYLKGMHQARAFMPPFPGNEQERNALAKYLVSLQHNPEFLKGVQETGIHNDATRKPSYSELNQ